MVRGSRTGGNPAEIDEGMRITIQSIKEVVGNHSDADIYAALKETNMDANETAQKLLNQDPFREVKRKRDRKKEVIPIKDSVDLRKQSETVSQGMENRIPDHNLRRGAYTRNSVPRTFAPRNSAHRNSAPPNTAPATNREFRVVRDNRSNLNAEGEMKPPSPLSSGSDNEKVVAYVNEKGSTGTSNGHQTSGARSSVHASNRLSDFRSWYAGGASSISSTRKEIFEDKQSVVGVYSSSEDPVHVPSPDSRSSSAIGAIKREVRAVKDSSAPSRSSNSLPRKDRSTQSYRTFSPVSKVDQLSQTTIPESAMPGASTNRSFLSNQHSNRSSQYGNRVQQQAGGHQKAPPQNKEWKPKSSQKSGINNPGVIGTPKKSSPPADNCMDMKSEAAKLQHKLSRVNISGNQNVNISGNQNVIIAEHIRIPETDRCRLTFGSFGPEFDSSKNSVSEGGNQTSPSLQVSAPETSRDGGAGNKPVNVLDDQVRHSGSDSPASTASEQQLDEKKEGSRSENLDEFADIGLLRGDSPSYAPSESKQPHHPPELQNFSAYDSQTGYDLTYFRPAMDETLRGQGLPFPQEALSSHTANSIPASTIAMLQQQQTPMTQMYPQVHVSHFTNLMPYRQFVSPVYVPQMPMPGYSGNPAAYPHPSNGNSYLLMPGGSSHLSANGLKYGFKPVPTGSPGFGNFNNLTGYHMNSPGVVGNAAGLEDSSRIKYKDGNIYVSNPQAETSEMWTQNPRDLPGLQSTPYYNVPGQTPHGAYLPSHTGHTSFNTAQSSHMQFQGLFHPPQPGAMPNPHHLGPAIGGNVGVGVGVAPPAPTAQVGTYQQPQLGHLNWPTNF